jgi:hydrogenase expression/formation protein HypC
MCLGIPGQIIKVSNPAALMATVDVSGIQREVNIACIVSANHPAESCVGDWVLVHVGFAMSRIDEEEARKTLEVLAELNEVQQELDAMQQGNGQ